MQWRPDEASTDEGRPMTADEANRPLLLAAVTQSDVKHRPQSMSDAVEVAARAIHDVWCTDPDDDCSARDDGQGYLSSDLDKATAALSAIGLPELLVEVERLRGVAEAARDLFEYMEVDHWCGACEEFQERGKGEYCPLTQRVIATRDAYAALLASEDKT